MRERGLAPGAHVPEQELADHFRVSRTPIRRALALLSDAATVERRPNRGYFVREAPALSLPTVAIDDSLYYRIAEERLVGELPECVTEMALVRRYETTRGVVRELLARMAAEGWAERLPGHGWKFLPAISSAEGYEQSFHFRALVEPAALRQRGYELLPEAIARCRESQRALLANPARFTDAEVFAIGAGFHEAIVAGSRNPFLIDALRRVNALRRLIEYRAKRGREAVKRQCTEHLRLLELIEAGKLGQAARFLEIHLATALRAKASLVGRARIAPVDPSLSAAAKPP